jgi:hypothetical protein
MTFPTCSPRHNLNSNLLAFVIMSSNSSPTAIPSYRKVLLDQIENSREILSFDPLDFKLKPFFWYVLLYRLPCKLKIKTRGQACGWQQTCDAGYVARVSCATQIPRAALFVSTLTNDRRRNFYRSQNPAQGLRGSHRGIRRRMPERTL